MIEGFGLSVWSLVEEKPHCRRPKGQLVDCPISGEWAVRSGCKMGASICWCFLQHILLTPGCCCTGTSWPRGCICVIVFNSSWWTSLRLISPVIFLASLAFYGNESHSVAMPFVKNCLCACARLFNLFPLLSTSSKWETKQVGPMFAFSRSLSLSYPLTWTICAVSCASQGLLVFWQLFLPNLHSSWTSPVLLNVVSKSKMWVHLY